MSWTESKITALESGHRRWYCLKNIIAEPSKSILVPFEAITPTPSRYSMHITTQAQNLQDALHASPASLPNFPQAAPIPEWKR
jgi:hypothetical protein